jgi:DNA-binding NarL/FixJ family response regulator
MARTTVLLADDHQMLIEALTALLRKHFTVCGVANDGRRMVEMVEQTRPDVIVADIRMPVLNGIEAALSLRKSGVFTKILFLTMYSDLALVEEAFQAGANGFMLKTSAVEELVEAIQAVARGSTYVSPAIAGDVISALITAGLSSKGSRIRLTPRQRDVLQLLAEGKTMKEAAACIGISCRTAETHKYEIMRQLGMHTTAELIRYAVHNKIGQLNGG